jgi:hypothetical protein
MECLTLQEMVSTRCWRTWRKRAGSLSYHISWRDPATMVSMPKRKRNPVPATPISLRDRVWFNVPQSADYTATSPFWIEERLRSGELPYRDVGRRVMHRNDLDALMQAFPVQQTVSRIQEKRLVVRATLGCRRETEA